jgi:hypothetical protein
MENKYLFCILFFFYGCSLSNSDSLKNSNSINEEIEKSNDWIFDQNGCLKLRSEKLAYQLINENKLIGSSQIQFQKFFGIPNQVDTLNNSEVLIYYFQSVCNGNAVVLKGDKCYANFYFNDDKLNSQEFICE